MWRRRWLQALTLAALVIIGGSIAPPAHAEWRKPVQRCTETYFRTHQWGRCGWQSPWHLFAHYFPMSRVGRVWCVAHTESRFYRYATNGQYRGWFQYGYGWYHNRFDPYSPVASTIRTISASRNGTYWAPWAWECGH